MYLLVAIVGLIHRHTYIRTLTITRNTYMLRMKYLFKYSYLKGQSTSTICCIPLVFQFKLWNKTLLRCQVWCVDLLAVPGFESETAHAEWEK